MDPQPKEQTLTPQLAARVEAHRAYLARLRQEQSDPLEALSAFIRKTFDRDALLATYEEYRNGGRYERDDRDFQSLEDPDEWDSDHAEVRPPSESARAVVSVGFSGDDFDRVATAARREGLTTAEFVRTSALARSTHSVEAQGNGPSSERALTGGCMRDFVPDDLVTAIAFYGGVTEPTAKAVLDFLIDHPGDLFDGAAIVKQLGLAQHRDVARATFALGEAAVALGRKRPWTEAQRGYAMPVERAELFKQARAQGA